MNSFNVPLRNIIVLEDRGRKQFTGLEELASSLKEMGLIHPIVVVPSEEEDKYILVAGERRYRAATLARWKDITATLRENLSLVEQKEIELEENIRRSNLDWQEQGDILAQIHELQQKKDKDWTLEKTAEKLGHSRSRVTDRIAVSKKLKKRPDLKPEVAHLPFVAAKKQLELIEKRERLEQLVHVGKVKLNSELKHGDCRELIKELEDESVDLILTDPPYGIEGVRMLSETGKQLNKMSGFRTMKYEHNLSKEEVMVLFTELAPEFGRILKPGAHIYIFCAVEYMGEILQRLAPEIEFVPPALYWDRGKPSTPGFGYNYLNCIETIIYGCKPPRGRRLNGNASNLLKHSEVPRNFRIYPTEKPVLLLRELIEQSTSVGELVLDPFAGSGSTLLATRESGRRGLGFEINKEAFLKAQDRLLNGNNSDK